MLNYQLSFSDVFVLTTARCFYFEIYEKKYLRKSQDQNDSVMFNTNFGASCGTTYHTKIAGRDQERYNFPQAGNKTISY